VLLVLVVTMVVVVAGVAHPDSVHASQQLGTTPGQPPRAMQLAAPFVMRHRVTPRRVMQHATLPVRPQVDSEAHRITSR